MKTPFKPKKVLLSNIFLLILLLNNQIIKAQWTEDEYPVCTKAVHSNTSVSISDEKGGVFIGWLDEDYDVYIQHIDSSGYSTWDTNGIKVYGNSSSQFHIRFAPDGNDGVFVIWEDGRNGNGNTDVFGQHVDKDGKLLWAVDGVLLAGGADNQTNPQIISDLNKGFVLVWEYFIDVTLGVRRNIQCQRFNSNGLSVWGTSAINITDTIERVESVSISTDSLGGAFISWTDTRKGNKIYVQHINSLGETIWGDGIVVNSSPQIVLLSGTSTCVADGDGGMFVAWTDGRNYSTSGSDIYAQHILSTGKIAYEPEGKLVCNARNNQYTPKIVTDGKGGAIIAWIDNRSYQCTYIQRIEKNSNLIFEDNGNWWGDKCGYFSILPDYKGGAFLIALDDDRRIFSRHLKDDGTFEWGFSYFGTTICSHTYPKSNPTICSDNRNGIIVVWDDTRNGYTNSNVFAQRVLCDGNLPKVATLSVSTNALTIAAPANSTQTFNITSNINWTIAKDKDWLSLSNTSGSNNATITLTAGANPTIATRTATITVSGAGVANKAIAVTQDGGATGISNMDIQDFKIYPNPANNILFMDGLTGVSKIKVFDINGKLILNKQIVDGSLDISNLKVGLYTISIESGKEKYTMKFEKSNNR